MAQKIVVCSDGTGNSFDDQVSNVARLVTYLDLSRPDAQVVFYDQGIGTDPKHANAVKEFRDKDRSGREALTVLDPPYHPWWIPARVAKTAGLTIGYGLERNVQELYTALANQYEDGAELYFFGFSRGAFTVRVLAGLLFRCGLLPKGTGDFAATFKRAYALYRPHLQDFDGVAEFKRDEHVREPRVHFLGLWDTVKSHGGIWPQSLPHLRHNPIVETVRHALALHEQRSWFLPTSWGGIDSDRPTVDPGCDDQDVVEIWFRGSHSDVGGGYDDGEAAQIPLRWMMHEAADAGLDFNEAGRAFAASSDPDHPPPVHDSLTREWLRREYVPRWELDNSYFPPKRFFKCGRTGKRQPTQFARQQTVRMHASVGPQHDIVTTYVETRAASSDPARRDDAASVT